MPLRGTKKEMFHEVRHGKTFARTARKFGKKKAVKQMEAIVLSTRRGQAATKKRTTARRKAAAKRWSD
jgi:hypothetical protein